MTPEQRRILRPTVKALVLHNKNMWWELKRQIYDGGGAGVQDWQSEYMALADGCLARMSGDKIDILIAEWRRRNMNSPNTSTESILGFCAALVAEEIVRRAEIAALRTVNW